ncbi:helix-turn-helix transcriptional regulator [Allostreptomyces psammosilenae]|uniref:Putative DNA-binding transcriptional regulator YafY n=1 Tax=Allostreptomyces psammosilenae TaxID=1892865 RepID=A0A852ZW96_9ACTN|nr:WYL domain-containing protein [Allostreptomyces psammosilenae]NYI06225.1 putative DNA-binding transcriptional regulator YafY [Allostreptomyces psammosilenae]
MRASRVISLLLLLQSRRTMTGRELAEELEVSERTVQRDIAALAEAGVPVYAERGRDGGYRLVDGYRTQLTGLDRAEAEALFLSGIPGPLREMGLAEPALAARLKVSAALAPGLRDAPVSASRRFHLDAPRWFAKAEPPPLLGPVSRAVWEDRLLRVRHQGRGGQLERTVEPYGLVLKAGVWYLAVRVPVLAGRVPAPPTRKPAAEGDVPEHRVGAIGRQQGAHPTTPKWRVYRVDRLVDAELLPERFTREEGFDLAEFWAARSVEFARSLLRERITVRLSPEGLRALPAVLEPAAATEAVTAADAAGPPDDQGWITIELPTESMEVAYHEMLRLGPEVEVLAPPGLRARMAEAAARLRRLYG